METLHRVRRHEDRQTIVRHGNEAGRQWVIGIIAEGLDHVLSNVTVVVEAASRAYSLRRTAVVQEGGANYCDDHALGHVLFEHGFIASVTVLLSTQRFVPDSPEETDPDADDGCDRCCYCGFPVEPGEGDRIGTDGSVAHLSCAA